MNDIVLNGETLEIGNRFDTIVIEGFEHTFDQNKMETELVVSAGGRILPHVVTFTENNRVYRASDVGYDGYSAVAIQVPSPSSTNLNVIEDGTYLPEDYDTSYFNEVNVDVVSHFLPTKFWQGTPSDYAGVTPSNDTLYIIKTPYNAEGYIDYKLHTIQDVRIGSTSILNREDSYWDWHIHNYTVPSNASTYGVFYWIDTGLIIQDTDTRHYDFLIEFVFWPNISSSVSGDRVICGLGTGATGGIRELYCNSSGNLYLYDTTNGDRKIYNGDISGLTVRFTRVNGVYSFSFGSEEPFYTSSADTNSSSNTLGIGKYRGTGGNPYNAVGTLDFFGFKWL